jgi:hypothetical protein
MGLERDPLIFVSTIEELLGRKSSRYGLENREYGRGNALNWPRDTLYPQTLALTSPTSGGLAVGIFRSRTKGLVVYLLIEHEYSMLVYESSFFMRAYGYKATRGTDANLLARGMLRLRFCHADSGQHEPPLLISRPPLPSLVTQLNYSCSEICHDMIFINCHERWTAVVRDTAPLLVIRVPHPPLSQNTKNLLDLHLFIKTIFF